MKKNFEEIGYWMNNAGGHDVELVKIDGEIYALHGWNGEEYTSCWKCADKFTEISDEEYTIKPVYEIVDEEFEDCEIIAYEVW